MAGIWPGRRAHISARLLSEAALTGALLLALASTGSDGRGGDLVVDPVASPTAAFTDPAGGSGNRVHVRAPGPPAVPSQAPIPSARPATILIASINVHRPVEAVGVDRFGRLSLPENLWNAGWYKGGPVPGAPGDAVIEGHAGYPKAPLLFARLSQLHKGDSIVVVLADGSRQRFTVDSLKVWPDGTGPPDMGQPYGPARLTLITCTGPFDDHYKTYADRLAVEATYAGIA
jgi:LPXTG-site transpeptidase (sortase) family protein